MIDPAVQAATVASAIAAGATVSGYLFAQSRARRERRATAFAEALTTLRRYQDFPYKIWWRQACDAETRARLADEQNLTGMQTNFHAAWLQVDAPLVGEAFQALADVVKQERRVNNDLAWQSPPISDDAGMVVRPAFQRRNDAPELELCIKAMRNELALSAPLRRRRIRREIQAQAARRRASAP